MSVPQVLLPDGHRLSFHTEIDSTNDEALRLAAAGEPGDIWVWAARQTAGRGRAGRRWESPEGNLFASLLMYPMCPPQTLPELGFVAGVALHDAVTSLLPEQGDLALALKWPNDLLLNGRKLSGLLLESKLAAPGGRAAVIGFGLNASHHPEETRLPATNLKREGITVAPKTALEALAHHFQLWRETWKGGNGFAIVRSAWLDRSIPIGASISIHALNEHLEGTFSGIDEDGALLLRQESGAEKRVTAGDVFPL